MSSVNDIPIKPEIPTILVIGGSDPTGGAGIQADLKTITVLGEYGAAAITAITVQNSHGVEHIEPFSPSLISQQILTVLTDHRVTHIKIGMVGSGLAARSIGNCLSDFTGEIIYDPVLAATTGHSLIEDNGVEMIKKHLLPVLTVITPNLPELGGLTGKKIKGSCNEEIKIKTAAQKLFWQYPNLKCIIVKGGHGNLNNNLLTDICFLKSIDQEITANHKHIHSINTHGTGCTLASAFAAYHSKTGDYMKSFMDSIHFVQRLLLLSSTRTVIINPAGKGPMLHMNGTLNP